MRLKNITTLAELEAEQEKLKMKQIWYTATEVQVFDLGQAQSEFKSGGLKHVGQRLTPF